MLNLNLKREKPEERLRKLSNGDRVGVRVIKERIVLAAETLFVSELGDYNGITLRMTLEEARQLQQDLTRHIAALDTQLATNPPSEN